MRTRLMLIVTAIVCWLPTTGMSGSLTTPQIVTRTTAATFSCLRWKPIGMCFWLRCSFSGCKVRSSLKIGHYNPDLVVSAYNEIGGNPWAEIRATLGLAQKTAATGIVGALLPFTVGSSGHRTEGTRGRDHRNLAFRETDAIGHPVSTASAVLAPLGLVCPSQTVPLLPYFQSSLDALSWRREVPESLYPASLVPGLREVGTWPVYTWGSVYPRTGWTTQSDEAKAAALNAQRAGDIVTRVGQPHLYLPVIGSPGSGKLWPPGPLTEGDSRTGDWQMLLPRAESTCRVFGENDLAKLTSWGGGKVGSGGDYAWNLWRPYKCCRRRGQWFLFDIDWVSYP